MFPRPEPQRGSRTKPRRTPGPPGPNPAEPQRRERALVPDVPLVSRKAVRLLECDKLFAKRLHTVVLLLTRDLLGNSSNVGGADAERSTSSLPCKVPAIWPLLMKPS